MKIYLFKNVEKLTDRYHCDGGLVIVATDLEHAKEQISSDENIQLSDAEWEQVLVYDLAGEYYSEMFIFPDAGCC